MIIFNDLSWQTRSDKPCEDWTNGQAKYVVEDGSELAQKLLSTPAWAAVEDENGKLIDITAIADAETAADETITEELDIEETLLEHDYRLSCIELGL